MLSLQRNNIWDKPTELNVKLAIFRHQSISQSACSPRYIPCGIAVGAWTVIDREAMRGPTFKNGTCVLLIYYRSILLKYNWKNPEQNAVAGTCQMCRAIQPVCVELYLQIQLHFYITMP